MSNQFQPPIYGLVFDMDGLIFNSERVVQRSWDYAGKVLGYEHFGEHIYHTIGFNVTRREAYFRENVCPDFPMEEFNQLTRKRYHQIVEEEGLEKKPGVEALLQCEGVRIPGGAGDLLAACACLGVNEGPGAFTVF